MTSDNVARSLQGENGQDCKALKDYTCKPARDLRCEKGETLAGWDRDGCVRAYLLTLPLFLLSLSFHFLFFISPLTSLSVSRTNSEPRKKRMRESPY